MKICSKCGVEKALNEFHKQKTGKFGVRNICKLCCKEYYKENINRIKEGGKEYYKENSNKRKDYRKEYYKENINRIKEGGKEYRKENADKIRKYLKERYHSDPQYKLKCNIRTNIREAFKLYTKNGKTMSCAEYGIDFKAIYDYVGPKPEGDYHLDHIIPVSVFKYDLPDHVKLAHLPQNLRWLDATENLSKSDTLDWELINSCDILKEIANQIGITNEPN